MLYHLLYPLHETIGVFNVFKYITFRTFGATATAILFCLLLGGRYIRWLKDKQIGQSVRNDGPQSHLSKKGTPTMGGGLILSAISISTLLWADLTNHYIWVAIFSTLGFGVIGWTDDYLKVIKKNSKGLTARQKIISQTLVALIASIALYVLRDSPPLLKFPFFKDFSIDLGIFFICLLYTSDAADE